MDWIHLEKIRAYSYTGFLPEEQVLGQWFEVNLSLGLDLQKAGTSDQIEDTIDYRKIISKVQEKITKSRFKLIEKLATEIAQEVLEYPLIQQVKIKLTKLAPPIPNFSGQITIELTVDSGQWTVDDA